MTPSNLHAEGTGASSAWTSDEPLLRSWREHVACGGFAAAEQLVATAAPTAAVVEARLLLPRLRFEWSSDRAEVLDRLRAEIAIVTDAQLDEWTRTGAIESLMVDGERRYFRREPRNLFLLDPEARDLRARARGEPPTGGRHDSTAPTIPELVEVVRAAERSRDRELLPVRTRVDYAITLKPELPGLRHGSVVRAWLPFPQEAGPQRNVRLLSSTPVHAAPAPVDDAHRRVHLVQTINDPAEVVRFDVSFDYVTAAVYTSDRRSSGSARARPPSHDLLAERPPHIVFTPAVREVVREQAAGVAADDLVALAKRLWHWVDDHIPWCAEHEYCLIPSIIDKAMTTRRGDCGVQTITFMTLCRCAGIPARWRSGWVTDPTTGSNMHDWCEIWLEALGGWVPCDPSYGVKQSDDPRVRDFYFGSLDRYRLVVNTDYGRPLHPPVASLRAEPLDFQRGEVELDGRVLYFDEWDYSFRFTHEEI